MNSDSATSPFTKPIPFFAVPTGTPPGTRVRATITLRCTAGYREVTGCHSYEEWAEYMNDFHKKQPTVFTVTDERGEIIGEERIWDTSIVMHISSRVIFPTTEEKNKLVKADE